MSLPGEAPQQRTGVRASVGWRDGRLLLQVDGGSGAEEVYVQGIPGRGARYEDAAAVLGLVPSMSAAVPLEVEGAVSPRLLANLAQAQRALAAWNESLSRVRLVATPRRRAEPDRGRGSATFFSGGVDSFYTLLERRDELTHLIFVHGFDLRLNGRRLRGSISEAVMTVASRLDLELIELETDIRRVTDPRLHWSMAHGLALGAVGLCLQEQLATIRVPGSYTYADMFPWGSHPLLDPLWSTEATEFVHDGFGVDRIEKVERLSHSDVALDHLRVCWENRDGQYNCGRCEKCVRTMISLAAVGALDRCSTFPVPLRPEAVRSLPLIKPSSRAFARQNLAAMEERGVAPDLADALRVALRRSTGARGLPRRAAVRARNLRRRLSA